jgi:hypothetical protein
MTNQQALRATGTFSITISAEPPYDERDGVSLGRVRFDKRFEGGLAASSVVHMLSARTAKKTSAAYAATERVEGTLDGRAGSFVFVHLGIMGSGAFDTHTVTVVPDSGTGELVGILGRMTIVVEDGRHTYAFDYTL